MNILYVGWIGYNNLGDELMFELFKEEVSQLRGEYAVDFVNCAHPYLQNAKIDQFDLIVIGGGSILNGPTYLLAPNMIEFLDKVGKAGKKFMIWGSGLDWLPEEMVHHEEKDMKTIIETDPLKVDEIFSKAHFIGVRGPLTAHYLKQAGIQKKIEVSGDPAFLIKNEKARNPLLKEDQKVIGVNWGTSFNHVYGEDEQIVEKELVKALEEFIQQGYMLYFYTVWEKDIEPAKRLYEQLKSEHVYLDTKQYDYKGLVSMLSGLDFTINFKLHANYLSLAAGTPFIALGYRFKIYDFAKSIDLDDFVLSMSDAAIYEQLLILEERMTDEQEQLVKKMARYKEEYRKRLRKPFNDESIFIER